MPKILLVDDDRPLVELVEQVLKLEHYQVETSQDGAEALEHLLTNAYDLAVIDVGLPTLSGFEICSQYRAGGGSIPILMLTARSELNEKVDGLESGADDYLTKPFQIDELKARLKALLRRAHRELTENVLALGKLRMEPTKFLVTVDGIETHLHPKEFKILELLVRYQGKVFSTDEIISRVWQNDEYPTGEAIRSHIRRIRKKLGKDFIKNIHGIGYRAESH